MIKNHCLLVQQEWISFLALFEYRILDMILSPHAVRIIPHDIGELPEVAEMAPILLKGPMFHSICFNLTQLNTPLHAAINLGLDPNQMTVYKLDSCKLSVSLEVVTTLNSMGKQETQRMLYNSHSRCSQENISRYYHTRLMLI